MTSKLSSILRLFLAATLSTACLSALRAEPHDEELQQRREQIRELDQKLRALERKQALKDDDAAARAKAAPVVTAGAGGFAITSADKAFDLKLKKLGQFDARFFLDDGALLTRAQISF